MANWAMENFMDVLAAKIKTRKHVARGTHEVSYYVNLAGGDTLKMTKDYIQRLGENKENKGTAKYSQMEDVEVTAPQNGAFKIQILYKNSEGEVKVWEAKLFESELLPQITEEVVTTEVKKRGRKKKIVDTVEVAKTTTANNQKVENVTEEIVLETSGTAKEAQPEKVVAKEEVQPEVVVAKEVQPEKVVKQEVSAQSQLADKIAEIKKELTETRKIIAFNSIVKFFTELGNSIKHNISKAMGMKNIADIDDKWLNTSVEITPDSHYCDGRKTFESNDVIRDFHRLEELGFPYEFPAIQEKLKEQGVNISLKFPSGTIVVSISYPRL